MRHPGFDAMFLYKIDCQCIKPCKSREENANSFMACFMEHAVKKAKVKK